MCVVRRVCGGVVGVRIVKGSVLTTTAAGDNGLNDPSDIELGVNTKDDIYIIYNIIE